jgi:acyl transferase domain-containing protein/SAM-dependent methyltransferase
MTNGEAAATPLSSTKKALLEIRKLRERLDEQESRQHAPLAIIGCGVRLPGGISTPSNFWDMLVAGEDAIGEIPPQRWDVDAYYNAERGHEGTMYTRAGGFLDDVATFDPGFFGISPREAISMDPQQRLMLEVTWEALEHAGQQDSALRGSRTGVFLGLCNSDYSRLVFADPASPDVTAATGNQSSVAAGRISYALGLRGPSMVIDTACSSSLVALHLAANSLRRGECDLAIVGGVNLILTPEMHINFCQTQMLSVDGRCKTFDAAADGYGRGEGCAAIVVKRADDAQRDNDRIIARVRGSAINQDGQSAGLTAPNGVAQESVIREALADAGVAAEDIAYVEAHGTGTPLGDPIEARALGATIGVQREPGKPLLVGSVKTNLGHLEAAAGVTGVIKAALSLYHGRIPAHLNYTHTNPEIALDEMNLRVAADTVDWPGDYPLLAGVSSFGFSGTNAHVVLEGSATHEEVTTSSRGPQVVTISARTDSDLDIAMRQYSEFLAATAAPLQDIAYTSSARHSHLEHRVAFVCDSTEHAVRQLDDAAAARDQPALYRGFVDEGCEAPKVVVAFAGQGTQYAGMGKSLYRHFDVYREALDAVTQLLDSKLGADPLLDVMHTDDRDDARINQTLYTQPATFSLSYALYELWRSFGLRAEVVLGHSLGEYMAAVAAGIFELEDAAALVAARARLTSDLPAGGSMAVVFADDTTVRRLLVEHQVALDIAAVNGPGNTVVSGADDVLACFLRALQKTDIEARQLNIANAFHSRLLDPALAEFESIASGITFAEPTLAVMSNVSGDFLQAGQAASGKYWSDQLRQPVLFNQAVQRLQADANTVIVEIAPHPALIPMMEDQVDRSTTLVSTLRRDADDLVCQLEALAKLHVRGVTPDWHAYHRGRSAERAPRITDLPNYPFRSERYWVAENKAASGDHAGPSPWQYTVTAGASAADKAPLNCNVQELEANWQLLRTLSARYVANALHDLGVFVDASRGETPDSVIENAGIEPTYRHLVSRWLDLLHDEGLLERDPDTGTFGCSQGVQRFDMAEPLAEVRRRYESEGFFADYLERCGEMLPDVVSGKVPALETLFPGGSSDTAEKLYTEFSVSRYISNIAAASVAAIAAASPRQIRALEIGAGTGGTTAAILPALPPGRVQYCFTDISDYFLGQAAQRFSAHEFLEFRTLDIGEAPDGQGFREHTYDVIVATNVLHATPDLRKTLANVLRLLASDGILVLSEVTRELEWYDISTGLIEGWQSFDDDLRHDSPMMSVATWRKILGEAGFTQVVAFPDEQSAASAVGQNVVLALAPTRSGGQAAAHDDAPQPVEATPVAAVQSGVLDNLRDAPDAERRDLLIDHVIELVCVILRIPQQNAPDGRAGLFDLGLDSLMALDFRRRLASSLQLPQELPATLIFDYPNAEAIAGYLDELLAVPGGEKRTAAAEETPAEAVVPQSVSASSLADLSDEDVEAMLLERLDATAAKGDR